MTLCQKCRSEIDRFLDDELSGSALVKFKRHLEGCPACQEELKERRLFLERIRATRPDLHAPAALRERVSHLLSAELTDPEAESPIRAGLKSSFQKTGHFLGLPLRWSTALTLSATTIVGVLVIWISVATSARANDFVQLAVDKHQQKLAGDMPLEKVTGSSAELIGWFSKRVAFPFRLPNYQGAPGSQPAYTLLGGTVIKVNRYNSAYVAYRMHQQLISLIVTARSNAAVQGGEVTKEKGLVFHSRQDGGLQVITWSVHNVTYALVASVTVPGRQSCVVCHSSPQERYLLKKPATRAGLSTLKSELPISQAISALRPGSSEKR